MIPNKNRKANLPYSYCLPSPSDHCLLSFPTEMGARYETPASGPYDSHHDFETESNLNPMQVTNDQIYFAVYVMFHRLDQHSVHFLVLLAASRLDFKEERSIVFCFLL